MSDLVEPNACGVVHFVVVMTSGSLSFSQGAVPPTAAIAMPMSEIIRRGLRLFGVMTTEWIATLRYLCCFFLVSLEPDFARGGRSDGLAARFLWWIGAQREALTDPRGLEKVGVPYRGIEIPKGLEAN